MAIYEIAQDDIRTINPISLDEAGLRERTATA